jgi:hypothetical protein
MQVSPLRLSILIVTYHSAALIETLLDLLDAELTQSFGLHSAAIEAEVIVLDNASQDDTIERIKTQYPWVKAVQSEVNIGFAAGNNLAAKQAQGQYLLLLNPDALPKPGALYAGVEMMDKHPKAGLGGGELLTPEGVRQVSARRFPCLWDEFFKLSGLAFRFTKNSYFGRLMRGAEDPTLASEVDWLTGAFVFIPSAVFKKLGGFDERFFMYFEEVDLCKRMRASGLTIQYWPHVKCLHLGGASAKTLDPRYFSQATCQIEPWRLRSYLLYYRKHHGWWGAAGAYGLERIFCSLREIKARLLARQDEIINHVKYGASLDQAWRDTAGGRLSPALPW